ncbi:uncharacterized protein BDZ99DRAFT_21245 [Mytilinidion resinicola]|uniref:Uncharacterized protein n=1 Tax=Mytilinidion resinicola TaxID=574789 RepID=A0A6A6Z950_9PEZI|nr:uncharacterized protein BDZ99DRAFT_21245 [Mytilinidion resinicola]KAF2817652.1 hypothetical protein BDZ99DRAFT_21245 [Mytilinidion resinicola]
MGVREPCRLRITSAQRLTRALNIPAKSADTTVFGAMHASVRRTSLAAGVALRLLQDGSPSITLHEVRDLRLEKAAYGCSLAAWDTRLRQFRAVRAAPAVLRSAGGRVRSWSTPIQVHLIQDTWRRIQACEEFIEACSIWLTVFPFIRVRRSHVTRVEFDGNHTQCNCACHRTTGRLRIRPGVPWWPGSTHVSGFMAASEQAQYDQEGCTR